MKKLKNEIISFINILLSRNKIDHVNILGFAPGDIKIWFKYIKDMDGHTKDKLHFINCVTLTPSSVKKIISQSIFNISTRFHCAVFSLSSGTPIYSIYSDKYYYKKIYSIHKLYNDKNISSIKNVNLESLYNFYNSIDAIKNNITSYSTLENIKILYNNKCNLLSKLYECNFNNSCKYNVLNNKNNTENNFHISIIIPIYNMGKYLKTCLDSVLNQSLKNIEVICINDGSTDNTRELLNEYSWKDSRIKIINQTNHGVAYSRNIAINLAKGEFLYFIDPDDWIPDKDVLKDLYDAAIKNNVVICGGSFYEVNKDKGLIKNFSGFNSKYIFNNDGFIKYSEYQFDYGWVRFIYKRSFILENNLHIPYRIYFEDPVFFVKSMSVAEKFYVLARPSYCYRSGHHSYDLSYEKVLDLLIGIRDILIIARDKKYDDLMYLEEYRLTNDYSSQIIKYLNLDYAYKLRNYLSDINTLLCRDSKRIELDILYNFYQQKVSFLENELARVYSSYNWRVGKKILVIPKKFAKILGIKH